MSADLILIIVRMSPTPSESPQNSEETVGYYPTDFGFAPVEIKEHGARILGIPRMCPPRSLLTIVKRLCARAHGVFRVTTEKFGPFTDRTLWQ
jgi:hypothetical protein